ADAAAQGGIDLPAQKRVPAAEIALVELDGPTQARLERVDVFAEFVAVQRHGRFEPQRVAGAEAARFAAAFDQLLPELDPELVADHDLNAVFAGVARAADDAWLPLVARRRGI